jgi:acyl dehydratase
MAVNTDFIGRTYPPSGPYAVTADDIAAFAAAVRATDPIHTDAEAARAAGYADVVAPPTFIVRFEQQCTRDYVADPEAGIDYSRSSPATRSPASPPSRTSVRPVGTR